MRWLSLFGSIGFDMDARCSAYAINVSAKMGVPISNQVFFDDRFGCRVPLAYAVRFEQLLCDTDPSLKRTREYGLIPFIMRYRKRIGLLVGMLVASLITLISPLFLWSIEIDGNLTLTDEEIIVMLDEAGLSIGSYLPDADVDGIKNAMLSQEDRISWMSVNLNGCIAYVEVREADIKESTIRELPYANVVASDDAVVSEIVVFSGMPAVKTDTFVNKGDLLISGVISKEAIGTRLTYASGKITGCVFEEIEVICPYRYEEMRESGRRGYVFDIHFFGGVLSLNILSHDFNDFDTHISAYAVSDGSRRLPIYIEKTVYSEKMMQGIARSEQEALRAGLSELNELIVSRVGDGEIISRETKIEYVEDSVILKCDLRYEKEIGRVVEFDVSE